jgi:hypothetical protein
MRRLLKEIGDRLQAFIDQRDDVALVLSSPAADSLPILKILEGLEEESTSDLFWMVTDNFVDAASYAEAVVKGFGTRHEVVRLAMQRQGLKPWPPIPPRVQSEATQPTERLRELAAFSRELLPVRNGGNNVWIFYPLEVVNHGAFAKLMADVLRHEFPFPWCHHLRFILRADPASPAMQAALAGRPRVRWYQPELGPEAIDRALGEEAADESLPLPERMAMLPIMAGNDFTRARYPEALEKYALLLRYHGSMNNFPLAAFALNGMGEVYERMGDLEHANESFEAALVPASQGDHPAFPIWLNVVVNLGNLCVRQQRWADGEAYFDVAQQLASAARDGPTKVTALRSRGDCQERQGKLAEAVQSWRGSAVVAAQLEDVGSCRAALARLEQHFAQAGQYSAAFELREQMVVLDTPRERPA